MAEAKEKTTKREDFTGGLSLKSSRNIENNQFEVLTNMFYNSDQRLQTRKGTANFGEKIGDEPVTSLFFYKSPTTGTRTLLATAGTDMYKYNGTTFDSIKTGLSQYETDGTTLTRWDFIVYEDIIYMCNGVDSYASYDGTTYAEYTTQPKVRYLEVMQDIIYGTGADTAPTTLYYSDTLPTNAQTIDTNDVIVGNDEAGKINIIKEIGEVVVAFKDKVTYSVDIANTSISPIDSQNGGYGNRAVKKVGNSLIYFNDTGVDTLKTKSGVTGSSALITTPDTDDLQPLMRLIKPNSYNTCIGEHIKPLRNYYFSFDTTGNKVPDTTLVRSALTGTWTKYLYPTHHDFCQYEDEDGELHYLIAGNDGQVMEIETGYNDIGEAIETELKTKKYEITDATISKTYDFVDIIGEKSENGEQTIQILSGDEVISEKVLDSTYIESTSSISAIGDDEIGVETIGGGEISASDEIEMFPYLIRVPLKKSGRDIQIRITSSSINSAFTLERINIRSKDNNINIIETNKIA